MSLLVTGVLFSVVMYNTGSVPDGLTAYAMLMRQSKRVVVKIRFMLLVRQAAGLAPKAQLLRVLKVIKVLRVLKFQAALPRFRVSEFQMFETA